MIGYLTRNQNEPYKGDCPDSYSESYRSTIETMTAAEFLPRTKYNSIADFYCEIDFRKEYILINFI